MDPPELRKSPVVGAIEHCSETWCSVTKNLNGWATTSFTRTLLHCYTQWTAPITGSCHSPLEGTKCCCTSRTWVAFVLRATEMYLICFINTETPDWLMLIICFATSQNARRGLSQETSQRVSFAVKRGSGCVSCYLNTSYGLSALTASGLYEKDIMHGKTKQCEPTQKVLFHTQTRQNSRTATECTIRTDILSYYYGHSTNCVLATHAANLIHSL